MTTSGNPQWVSIAVAAEALGEHRQQLYRMIRIGTFPRGHVDQTGSRVMVLLTDDLGRKLKNGKRLRIS